MSASVKVSPISQGPSPSRRSSRVWASSNSKAQVGLTGERLSSGWMNSFLAAVQQAPSSSSTRNWVMASWRARSSVPAGWVSAPWRSARKVTIATESGIGVPSTSSTGALPVAFTASSRSLCGATASSVQSWPSSSSAHITRRLRFRGFPTTVYMALSSLSRAARGVALHGTAPGARRQAGRAPEAGRRIAPRPCPPPAPGAIRQAQRKGAAAA